MPATPYSPSGNEKILAAETLYRWAFQDGARKKLKNYLDPDFFVQYLCSAIIENNEPQDHFHFNCDQQPHDVLYDVHLTNGKPLYHHIQNILKGFPENGKPFLFYIFIKAQQQMNTSPHKTKHTAGTMMMCCMRPRKRNGSVLHGCND